MDKIMIKLQHGIWNCCHNDEKTEKLKGFELLITVESCTVNLVKRSRSFIGGPFLNHRSINQSVKRDKIKFRLPGEACFRHFKIKKNTQKKETIFNALNNLVTVHLSSIP
jgi:hypothetical protein